MGAFITSAGFLKLLQFAYDAYKDHKKLISREDENGVTEAILAYAEVYNKLRDFCNFCDADRVILLQCNDSKAVPDPGAEIKSTAVLMYSPSGDEQGVKSNWKARIVDYEYAMLLKELVLKGETTTITSRMSKGMLKDAYEAYDVYGAYLTKICEFDGNIWYISVTWKDKDGYLLHTTPKFKDRINALKSYLNDYLRGEI